MTTIKLTDEEFDTLTSIVSYAVFDECQLYNGIHTENFRLERNTSIDDWEICFVIEVRRKTDKNNTRTVISTHIDHISTTLNDKAVELTDAQMNTLNGIVNYTVEGSL